MQPPRGEASGEPVWAAAWVPWAWQQPWVCSPILVCLQPACWQPAAWPRQVVERVLPPLAVPVLRGVSEERRAAPVLLMLSLVQPLAC